jgi:hypothetical protein
MQYETLTALRPGELPGTCEADCVAGSHITTVCFELVAYARAYRLVAICEFNDVSIFAHPQMQPSQVHSLYQSRKGRRNV